MVHGRTDVHARLSRLLEAAGRAAPRRLLESAKMAGDEPRD